MTDDELAPDAEFQKTAPLPLTEQEIDELLSEITGDTTEIPDEL